MLALRCCANRGLAAGGVEVVPRAWLLTRCARRAAEWLEGNRRRPWELFLLAALTPAMRPEGALGAALIALALLFMAPPLLVILVSGDAQVIAIVTWALMAIIAQPMLAHYRVSSLWGLAMPAIGTGYGIATLMSAVQHWRGRGGLWKGRVQAQLGGAA